MNEKSTPWFIGSLAFGRMHVSHITAAVSLPALVLGSAISIVACGGDGTGASPDAGGVDGGGPGTGSDAGGSPEQDAGPSQSGPFSFIDMGIQCYAAAEPSTTIRVGGDCSATIYADYHGEQFSEPIVLSVDDLPAGVIAEIVNVEPEGLVPNTASTLNLHIRGAAPAGPLDITVRGTTATHGSATLTFSITITSSPGFPLDSVSVGYHTSCGLDGSGKAYCWGDNLYGQLGIGTSGLADNDNKRTKPIAVDTAIRFSAIIAGERMTCGIDTDAQAYCWGQGWLGDGTFTDQPRPTPIAVEGGLSFVDLVTPGQVTCGRTTTGSIYCWGGSNGFLGNGTLDNGPVPTDISAGRTYEAIAAAAGSLCVVATGGTAYCWGDNTWGQLGDGTVMARLSPTPVKTSLKFRSIAVSSGATCGLTGEGKAYCWGTNASGSLGLGKFDNDKHLSPEPVTGGLTFASLVGGGGGFCGLDQAGRAYCWGFAGTEDNYAVPAPTAVSGELTFSQIAVGSAMNCGIATNGLKATYCWLHGSGNYDGYLGTGDTESYAGPVPIARP